MKRSSFDPSPSAKACLSRLLDALVQMRIVSPGGWIDGDALADATWQGERMLPSSKQNRLHVPIATLRKLGLREVLESKKGAHRIARELTLIVVD